MLPLSYVLFCVSGIVTGNQNRSPYDVLGSSLDVCGTNISRLNFSPMSPLIKSFLFAIHEALIFFRKVHENMVLYATPSHGDMYTIAGCSFSIEVFFR